MTHRHFAYSHNSGASWTLTGPLGTGAEWGSICGSSDGTLWSANIKDGIVWHSEDSGVTWAEEGSEITYRFIRCSDDGKKRLGFQVWITEIFCTIFCVLLQFILRTTTISLYYCLSQFIPVDSIQYLSLLLFEEDTCEDASHAALAHGIIVQYEGAYTCQCYEVH
jgi:hypothetical protein